MVDQKEINLNSENQGLDNQIIDKKVENLENGKNLN